MSDWFGVKIKGLPKMNPKRFDAWCEERGLNNQGTMLQAGGTSRHPNPAP